MLKKILLWTSILAFLLLCTATIIVAAWQTLDVSNRNLVSFISAPPPTATPTPLPRIERTPVATLAATFTAQPAQSSPIELQSAETSEEAGESVQASPLQLSTEQLLLQTTLPVRDQRLLAMRLKPNSPQIPEVVRETPSNFQPGDIDTFWVGDNQETPPRQFEVTATLKFITDHSYWWVQDGFNVNEEALKRSAEQFENNTYPTNRAFFGSEWSPGIDGDVRIHVFLGDVPGVAGYFSATHEYSKLAEMYSNEREMFFLNLKAISPGNSNFDSVLAHEFQHMIHWYQDRNEDTWVNEGLSELATFINGYGTSNFVGAFSVDPDTQLTSWPDTPNAAIANYGGSFLFMTYFLQRYGEEMTQAVVANPKNGVAGFDAVLAEHGFTERFDDIFASFLVANYLYNPDIGDGAWGYNDLPANPVAPTDRYSIFPQNNQATVYQYGGDYIELAGQGDVTIQFTGSTQVKVVDNEAHSGDYQWYSHRGDDTNTRLTRTFDLRKVNKATLNYWTWYDIEANWDYGYVEISTDGGQTWTILQAPHSATENPTGNAYGPGYTSTSGQNEPTWVEDSIDLATYTGQEVQIRFEYVTDDAVNRPGWTIDDVSIPEIGFSDDVEIGPNGWQAEGFVRMDNTLPQRFLVQVLETGTQIKLRSMPLDETNSGSLTVTGLGNTLDRAVIIVSGLTPITTQPASYGYKISQ